MLILKMVSISNQSELINQTLTWFKLQWQWLITKMISLLFGRIGLLCNSLFVMTHSNWIEMTCFDIFLMIISTLIKKSYHNNRVDCLKTSDFCVWFVFGVTFRGMLVSVPKTILNSKIIKSYEIESKPTILWLCWKFDARITVMES